MALNLFKKYFLRDTQLSTKKDVGVTKANSLDLQAYINQTVEDSGAVGDLPIPTIAGESGQILTLTSATTSEWQNHPEVIVLVCSDETTTVSAGANKISYYIPFAIHVTEVKAALTTAQTSGNAFTIDVEVNGTSIIGGSLAFTNGENLAEVTVSPEAVVAEDALITVDVDQIGDETAKGLKVHLIAHRATH